VFKKRDRAINPMNMGFLALGGHRSAQAFQARECMRHEQCRMLRAFSASFPRADDEACIDVVLSARVDDKTFNFPFVRTDCTRSSHGASLEIDAATRQPRTRSVCGETSLYLEV